MIKILRDNSATDYGERYHFSAIQTVEGFQYRVPVGDYEMYKPLISLQTKIGEKGIFSHEDTTGYIMTSLENGEPEFLPNTMSHQRVFDKAFAGMIGNKKTVLLAESLPQQKKFNDNNVLNTLSGHMLTNFYMNTVNSFGEISDYFTSPIELLFPKRAIHTNFFKLLFALADSDVEQIVAPFSWGVLEFFSVMENRWQELCNCIESGEIIFSEDIPEEYQQKLRRKFTANPKRAEELRNIFADGFSTPVAKKIWPHLERVVASGTGTFEIYTDCLKKYIGDVPFENAYYICAEGLIGKAVADSSDYELITDTNFYEFIDIAKADAKPVTASELEVDRLYELVITNTAGLYRYRMGDIVKIKSTSGSAVIFEPVSKRRSIVDINGTLITSGDIYGAIRRVGKANDFMYALSDDRKHLVIYIETDSDKEKLASCLNSALMEVCDGYKELIRSGEIGECIVKFVQPETQLLLRDKIRFSGKIAPEQIKPVRYITDSETKKFFDIMQDE